MNDNKECKYCKSILRSFHQSQLTDYFHWYCDKCKAHCTQPRNEEETWRTEKEFYDYVNE
jgi:hypothetical protein